MSQKVQFGKKDVDVKALKEMQKKLREEAAAPETKTPLRRRYVKGDGMTKEKPRINDGVVCEKPAVVGMTKPLILTPGRGTIGGLKPISLPGSKGDGSHLIPDKFRPLELNANKFNRAFNKALKTGEPWAQELQKFVEGKYQDMAGIKVGYDKPLPERIKDLADKGQDWAIVWMMQNKGGGPREILKPIFKPLPLPGKLPTPELPGRRRAVEPPSVPSISIPGYQAPPQAELQPMPGGGHVVTVDPATGDATCGGASGPTLSAEPLVLEAYQEQLKKSDS